MQVQPQLGQIAADVAEVRKTGVVVGSVAIGAGSGAGCRHRRFIVGGVAGAVLPVAAGGSLRDPGHRLQRADAAVHARGAVEHRCLRAGCCRRYPGRCHPRRWRCRHARRRWARRRWARRRCRHRGRHAASRHWCLRRRRTMQHECRQQQQVEREQRADRDHPGRIAASRLGDTHFEQSGSALPLPFGFGFLQCVENQRHQPPRVDACCAARGCNSGESGAASTASSATCVSMPAMPSTVSRLAR